VSDAIFRAIHHDGEQWVNWADFKRLADAHLAILMLDLFDEETELCDAQTIARRALQLPEPVPPPPPEQWTPEEIEQMRAQRQRDFAERPYEFSRIDVSNAPRLCKEPPK
jgi:hypothetical protein